MVTPLINGILYSWANVTLQIFGAPLVGATKISYKTAQKKENQYGLGVDPIGRGYGNKEYTASVDMYLDDLKRIIQAAANRDILAIPPFDIQVTWASPSNRIQTLTDILRSCEFLENPVETSQGDTKSIVTLPLIVGRIEYNQ
jgi:hypothetical protein